MAERRMFAKTVIDSDAFLDMPLSTQALYFHLGMRADDDGFLNNAQKLMRMVSASKNDYDLLLVKGFIIQFEGGICAIRHWRMHNYIRSDRYKPTVYQKQMKSLALSSSKIYEFSRDEEDESLSADTFGIPEAIPCGAHWETQDRLGKDRLDKISIVKSSIDKASTSEDDSGEFNIKQGNAELYNAGDYSLDEDSLAKCNESADDEYTLTKAKLNQLKKQWNSLGLSKVINFKHNRLKMLNARVKEYGLEEVFKAINKINDSDFLKGDNRNSWTITFDWFIRPNNFLKVLEGNYVSKSSKNSLKFNDYAQRSYGCGSYEELERKLLGWEKEDS